MIELHEFILKHAMRGSCLCGRCADAPEIPDQPSGHTADLIFFKVAARENPSAEEFERLVRANVRGDFASVDLFDGQEHSYLELGAWIGDQGQALQLMGLGTVLGLWELLTPVTVLKVQADSQMARVMAGQGLVCIRAKRPVKVT